MLIKLLEVNPEKRITAKKALDHDFLSINFQKFDEVEDEGISLEQKLKNFNSRKFEFKNISDLNDTLYIPIDIPNNVYIDEISEFSSTNRFITNKPCMNGIIGSSERLNSFQSNDDPIKFDKAQQNFVESPGLKQVLRQKVCYYDRKSPYKTSNFLEFATQNKKSSDEINNSPHKNTIERYIYDEKLSPLSPTGLNWKRKFEECKNQKQVNPNNKDILTDYYSSKH